jgi:hypothetical protein
MIAGAVIAGLLIVALFFEMISGPKPAETREPRVPAAK